MNSFINCFGASPGVFLISFHAKGRYLSTIIAHVLAISAQKPFTDNWFSI